MTRHLQVSSSGVQGGGKRRAGGMQPLLARRAVGGRSAAERASATAVVLVSHGPQWDIARHTQSM